MTEDFQVVERPPVTGQAREHDPISLAIERTLSDGGAVRVRYDIHHKLRNRFNTRARGRNFVVRGRNTHDGYYLLWLEPRSKETA